MARRKNESGMTYSPGVISVLEVYTLDELKLRLRWTDSSLRSARRKGLRLLGFGKRKFAKGREVLRFLEAQAAELTYQR